MQIRNGGKKVLLPGSHIPGTEQAARVNKRPSAAINVESDRPAVFSRVVVGIPECVDVRSWRLVISSRLTISRLMGQVLNIDECNAVLNSAYR